MKVKKYQDFINESKKIKSASDIVKILKNPTDWGDLGQQVYVKKGNMVYVDTFFYGGQDKLDNVIQNWSPGGMYYDYFKDNYNIQFEIVDSFMEINARGRHKKLTDNGIAGVELTFKHLD